MGNNNIFNHNNLIMETLTKETKTWMAKSYCDKCKKPFAYIGDPLPKEVLREILCTCNIEKIKCPKCGYEFI